MLAQIAPSSQSIGTHTKGARIAALIACVPKGIVNNAVFIESFGEVAEQIIKMTGVKQRHVVSNGQTTSDLCVAAAEELFEQTHHLPEEIDAILFFTQTPDYRLPATACQIQTSLGLRKGIVAFDVNLGCSAYPYALWLGSMMIESGAAKKVLLCVGDTISRIVSPDDRATAMLFGDCGTATLLVADAEASANFVLGSDGSGVGNLIVPEGCFRSNPSTDLRNSNPADKLFMDGGEIFSFTLKAVPNLFSQLCAVSGTDAEAYEKVLFHQANAFMINHLRKKTKLPEDKVPINISRFGNTSSASIPLLWITECRDALLKDIPVRYALLGFGVGYSWAAASIMAGGLDCVSLVER